MKTVIRLFAVLDILCFIFLKDQAVDQIESFLNNNTLTALEFFSRTLFLTGWLSLLVSAVFLLLLNKVGSYIYYIQLPLRFIYYMFSFGFISLLTYWVQWPIFLTYLTPLIVFGEFVRIYFTYISYKKGF